MIKNFKYYSRNSILLWIDGKNFKSINPLTALKDIPAGSNYNKILWNLHKITIEENIKNIKFFIPSVSVDKYDPLKLRFLFSFILMVSLYWSYANNSLKKNIFGFVKVVKESEITQQFEVKAWLSPPKYTRLQKKLIDINIKNNTNSIEELVPINSSLNIYIKSENLNFNVRENGDLIKLREIEKGNFESIFLINENKSILIDNKKQNLIRFNLSVIKDNNPEIQFLSNPYLVNSTSLAFVSKTTDDYGIKEVNAYIKKPLIYKHFKEDFLSYNIFSNINLEEDNSSIESYFFEYLADQVWAGSDTFIEIIATDQAHQKARITKPIKIPSRNFNDKIANDILELREKLAKKSISSNVIREKLIKISKQNKYFFENENIKNAFTDFIFSLEKQEVIEFSVFNEIFKKLYVLAEIIENEKNYFAKRKIDKIEQDLFDSIKKKETDEVITHAQKLKDNINSLLDLENKKINDKSFNKEKHRNLKDQIKELTQQIEDLLKTGSKEGINEKMQELKQLTDSIKNPNNNKEVEAKLQKKKEFINKLSELLNDQEKIMEETFNRAAERGKFEQSSEGSGGKSPKERQDNLRNTLGNVMREIGASENEIPQELGRADRAMRQASRDLENGRPDEASNAQGRAIEMIQQSINKINLEEYTSDKPQMADQGKENNANNKKEYLSDNENTQYQGTSAGGNLNIPNRSEVKNVSKIAKKLYKRYNEENRSLNDKKHIKNLLDWY